jgi:hypothetical protein
MAEIHVEPWIPPAEPSLGRLAMEAADEEGLPAVRAWPEVRGNGVVFGDLPPFLCWTGSEHGRRHLVLLQARELGAVVQGARPSSLPGRWLAELELESLVRPLRRHPCFPEGVSVHVVRVPGPGESRIRSIGAPAPALLQEVLSRLTGIDSWEIHAEDPRDL